MSENDTAELRSALLSMGATSSSGGADMEIPPAAASTSSFHGQLAVQVCQLLVPLLKAKDARKGGLGGCVDLTSAYCRVNRARGVQLISPDDLLEACRLMGTLNLPLRMKKFSSGVAVSIFFLEFSSFLWQTCGQLFGVIFPSNVAHFSLLKGNIGV